MWGRAAFKEGRGPSGNGDGMVLRVEPDQHDGAWRLRALIDRTPRDPAKFRAALARVPPSARDACVDRALGLGELPADGPAAERVRAVPALSGRCAAARGGARARARRRPVRRRRLRPGARRRAGAPVDGRQAIGLEIQPSFVAAARALAARLRLPDLSFVEGDAPELGRHCRRFDLLALLSVQW